MQCRNSPLARTPPTNLPMIPGVTCPKQKKNQPKGSSPLSTSPNKSNSPKNKFHAQGSRLDEKHLFIICVVGQIIFISECFQVLNLILFSSATRMHSSTWICRLSTDFWTDNNSCHQSAQLSLFHTFSCFTYLSDSSKLKSGHCWLGVSTSSIKFHQYLFLSPRLISQWYSELYMFSNKKSSVSFNSF